MAMSDYYLCDLCGNKCFYDANCYEQMEQAGDVAAICKKCGEDHECIIVEKSSSNMTEHLKKALREICEVWAGSEGMVNQTASEAYQTSLIEEMRDIAAKALKEE